MGHPWSLLPVNDVILLSQVTACTATVPMVTEVDNCVTSSGHCYCFVQTLWTIASKMWDKRRSEMRINISMAFSRLTCMYFIRQVSKCTKNKTTLHSST